MKRSLTIALLIVATFVIFAYGFSVTQVNLEELGQESRQQALTRILRALAHPDFITFDQEQVEVNAPVYVPCPADGEPAYTPDTSGPYMTVTPSCGDPRAEVVVEGVGFAPDTNGVLYFIPDSGVQLQIGRFETDGGGYFQTTVRLRDRESDQAQQLRATTRRNIGNAHLSQNGIDTINKIIETVFMALLATAIGTILAIPVSFLAARNLMATVTSPVASVALTLILVPLGVWLGGAVTGWLGQTALALLGDWLPALIGLLVSPVVATVLVRWALPPVEKTPPGALLRLMRAVALVAVALLAILAFYLFAALLIIAGERIAPLLGSFAFLGEFVANLGGIIVLVLPIAGALIGGGVFLSIAGRIGNTLADRLSPRTLKAINIVLCALAGMVVALLIGAAIEWLYQLRQPRLTVVWPAIIGTVLGIIVAVRSSAEEPLPLGLAVYGVTRTILNALRSVEALIMVIVFAVWVGIGPFAGVLALGLHTVAALAKLYSEQVESIANGPLEAVIATGANRLQMIVYAVIPQIVAPYISFTMYRWDINVRMSTIIGFAGGGGIGFLLQQNINLLNYRAASAQIIAIAIVVSLMDYFSSYMRQRVV